MTVKNEIHLTSMTPHLLPAMRNWMIENNFTPEMVVDTSCAGVDVPISIVKDNMVIIACHPRNCSHVVFNEDGVSLGTRFNRIHTDCFFPYASIVALRAREQPIIVPLDPSKFSMGKKDFKGEERIDRIQVGKVEYGDTIKKTKGGIFGVVDGAKND